MVSQGKNKKIVMPDLIRHPASLLEWTPRQARRDRSLTKSMTRIMATGAILSLTACSGIQEKIEAVGKPPAFSSIQNPRDEKDYKPVSMPMPEQVAFSASPNALWQPGRQTFFKDQRANKVGDILTVLVTISDQANLKNKTERARNGTESASLPNLLGLETIAKKVLPDAADLSKLAGMSSDTKTSGDGKITRSEDIQLKLAAMITQVLPNGNFVLRGRQEVRVNAELRQLTLSGLIRPEDVLNNNSVSYEKIAEARISYGGKGDVSDIQTPRYGQQFFDAVFPF